MPERTLHRTPPRQPWRFLFYEEGTLWDEIGVPTVWRFSGLKIAIYVILVPFIAFMVWLTAHTNAKAENYISEFAAECADQQGSVYEIGDEKVCVDKTGRIVWLDSQRSEQ